MTSVLSLLNSIEFARPLFLWWLPISLALIYLLFWFWPNALGTSSEPLQNLAQPLWRHPATAWLSQFVARRQRQGHILWFIKRSLAWSIFVCLIHLSLAQPYQQGQRLPDKPPQQRDIVFVIDSSVSMVLEDYLVDGRRTSRMAVLQSVMQHFIDRLQGSRIGLIVYSEQVYTLAPLTTDYRLLKRQFNRIIPAALTGRTSNPGKALLYTLHAYRDAPPQGKPGIVLISDVNRPDREIDPRVAASALQQQGFHVHTIAIGAGSYAAQNRQGTHLVYHPTNYSLLQQIAEHGRGKFFTANSPQSIHRALLTIQQTETRSSKVEPQYVRINLYYWPLLLAVLLLTLLQLYQLGRKLT